MLFSGGPPPPMAAPSILPVTLSAALLGDLSHPPLPPPSPPSLLLRLAFLPLVLCSVLFLLRFLSSFLFSPSSSSSSAPPPSFPSVSQPAACSCSCFGSFWELLSRFSVASSVLLCAFFCLLVLRVWLLTGPFSRVEFLWCSGAPHLPPRP